MIFESELERAAFDFICDVASDEFSRRGCNDLEEEFVKKFEGLTVECEDFDGSKIMRPMTQDSDVIQWLKGEVKDGKTN